MPKLLRIGIFILIGLNALTLVQSQDDEADGFSDSYEPFSTHHDMYGESSDVDIDHRIGGVDESQNRGAKSVTGSADQKPAESLLSMSMDPLSDGMAADPDIRKVLADVEAQVDELRTSATSNRVPHQLNLAVGSSSSYTAPVQQLQYQQPLQGPPPPPQSTLSVEHQNAIAQLALQQQQAMAQLAGQQRLAEQQRLQQEAVQAVQYQQQAQPQQQFVQQPTPTATTQAQQTYIPSTAPQLIQQFQQQPQQAPIIQQAVPQFAQPSPTPQLVQYQQQQHPQQLLQHYQSPSPSAIPQLLSQAVGFGQQNGPQAVHQQQQGPTQATPIQQQQELVYQTPNPSQAPFLQQQLQQLLQGPSQAPPSQVVQQQQPQLFQSASPSPQPQVVHQQQVFQGQHQQAPVAQATPQPQLHVVQTPLQSLLSSLQVQQQPQQVQPTGPSQAPVQQVQQVYQQQQQPTPSQQPLQYQQNPLQYQIPTAGSTPVTQPQAQQFIYQNPSPVPQILQHQQQAQQQIQNNGQQQQLQGQVFPAQFPEPHVQFQQQPQQQQPFQAGTPLSIEQYHRQVNPASASGQQQLQEQTLALGSEQSAAVSSSAPQVEQPKPTPQNIQEILQQQSQPETSDESSDYQEQPPPPLQQQQQQQMEIPSLETSTRYPQTYEIQEEYEKTINNNNNQSPFSPQDLLDANRELNQYAQTIEERAASILENFRRQVLGQKQKQETPTQDPPTTTTVQQEEVQTEPVQEVPAQEQLNEAVNPQNAEFLQPTPTPTQQSQAAIEHQQQSQDKENELVQEGQASIHNQVVHTENSLQYPGNQFGGGIQQQQLQLQLQQSPPKAAAVAQTGPMQQTQAVIQQVIETQAIQQNSLQQLWQLYQQQALQQQQLLHQQELQRQAALITPQPQVPYQLVPQVAPTPAAPVAPKRRPPPSSAPPVVPNYAQQFLPGPVQYPSELLPSQPGGQVYYQQFIGPVPTDPRRPAPGVPQTVHDNDHYTIYKVKDDHDYRTMTGLLPADQQIKIETSHPVHSGPGPQFSPQLPYNPYQLQPQRQTIPEPGQVQIPDGQELVPLEEVGNKEEAHAFLQLPAHIHDPSGQSQHESFLAPGPGPTQAPHTRLPVPQAQTQQQPAYQGGSEYYQVKSHSYAMPPQQQFSYPGQPQVPAYAQQPSHQIQIQPQQFESVPAFSEEQPTYQDQNHQHHTTVVHHHSYSPQQVQEFVNTQHVIKPPKKQKVHYPKPVVTSTSMHKPSKRLRNKSAGTNNQYMVANMEYRPQMLPADEASFAAHQAKVLGGPAFRDEGYNFQEQARSHSPPQPQVLLPQLSSTLNMNVNPTAAAQSFGFALNPLLRLGKLSATAFKHGFDQKMQKIHEAANRRNTQQQQQQQQSNPNVAIASSRADDEMERQQIAAEASALSPTIAIALPTTRRKHNRNKSTSILEHLEQAFSPRAGEMEGDEVSAPVTAPTRKKKHRKSAAYRERQAVLADLLKATAEADGVQLVPAAAGPS